MPGPIAWLSLAKLKWPLLLLVLGAAYTAGTFYAGYDYSRKATQAKLAKEYRNQIAKMHLQWVDDRARLGELQARLSNDVRKIQVIREEVPVYVTPDKDEFCDPPVGVVRLLNDARRPDLPAAAGEPDAEGRAPSGIGYTGQINDTLDITGRYNAVMLQCNALIEWIEDNYGPVDRSGFRGSLERHEEVPSG